ncbi:MAG TPA: hypothetical protein V6D17_12795 [Candidatus Obscuribacterales bacterium]
MIIRRATESDFEKIVTLEIENLSSNLTAEQKQDGFLSAYFNAEQLEEIDKDIGTIVAAGNGSVLGFLCVTSAEFNRRFSLSGTMVEKLK